MNPRITHLSLVLTNRCNQRCAYCYQNAKNAARMEWSVVEAALRFAASSSEDAVEIAFYGGEPLLEFPLLRRAVARARRVWPRGKELRFGLITNGSLLGPTEVDYLVENDFRTLLSFDGVPEAQALRGKSTFRPLDALLDLLRREHPAFLRSRLRVGITLMPATVRHLADSVEYFIHKGVKQIVPAPVITHAPDWNEARRIELETQFERIIESSVSFHRMTGLVPFAPFHRRWRPPRRPPKPHTRAIPMCGVLRPGSPVVAPEGQVFACVTIADSYQRLPSGLLQREAARFAYGDIREQGFADRFTRTRVPARRVEMFTHRERKYSSYGKCAECPYLDGCTVCPTSIGHIPGNTDPHRIPDFACAWSRTALRACDAFGRLTDASAGPSRPGWASLDFG